MTKLLAHLPTGARVVLGLIFFVFGLNGFLNFMPVPPVEGAAAKFMGGLAASGFFFPLLKITEIAVGAALLSNRFVPLALVVLAPVTVNIVAYHAALAPAGLAMPLLIAAAHVGLAWHHRSAFGPLLSARSRAATNTAAATSETKKQLHAA